jgi:hypothetical protein
MKLEVGDRLPPDQTGSAAAPGGGPLYRVTGVAQETAWHVLYEGKKVFRNFHFGRRALEETAPEESLDVFLRTILYAQLDDREYVNERRKHARETEGKKVLGNRRTNLLPEPLDCLELSNEQDVFPFIKKGQFVGTEPVLVFERVHGEPLARWRLERRPALPRLLRVGAEVLDFAAVLHEEQLLLNGLSNVALWIDDMDRVHYLATDLVLDLKRQRRQRRLLFPPERYPRGFSAPEAFDPDANLDPRADLYSWAALVYFLVTSHSPVALAQAQGERHARFGPAELERLHAPLRRLTPPEVARVQTWLEVPGNRFAASWPDGFVAALAECLQPQPERRPESRAALRQRWELARPRPVPVALAVRTPRAVEVLLSGRGLGPGVEMVVRRGAGSYPQTEQAGHLVAEGPLRPRTTDTRPPAIPRQGGKQAAAPCYSVFTRADGLCSPPAQAPLLDLSLPEQVAAFADELAAHEPEPASLLQPGALPEAVALLETLPEAPSVAESWLAAQRPLVRRWGVRLLEGALRRPETAGQARELLLRRGLTDTRLDLRLAAARALFAGERRPALDVVLQVAGVLGGARAEARLEAVRSLEACDLDAETLAAARRELEREVEMERESPCELCGALVRRRDEAEHLRTQHGIYEIDGQRRSWEGTLRYLGSRLFRDSPGPDPAAFLAVAGDRLGPAGAVARLGAALLEERAGPIDALLAALAGLPQAEALGRWLLEQPAAPAGVLGLALFGASAEPQRAVALAELVTARLADAALPAEVRQEALAKLLGAGLDEERRGRAVEAFVRSLAEPMSVETLRLLDGLEARAGKSRLLNTWRSRVRAAARVRCQQCQALLPLTGLAEHLWDEHRMLLEGERPRGVWTVIDECLARCAARPDEAELRRALELAERADPLSGAERFARAAHGLGIRHALVRQHLPRELLRSRMWPWLVAAGVAAVGAAGVVWWLVR